MDLKGKRLLILGGSLWKDQIKKIADDKGITLIATGNDQNAGIFEIANESYNVNSTDIDAMKKLIKEKKIDGVYMGGSEPVISAASVYVNEMGLPCYCTKQQWEYLQNKSNFKNLCIKFGLPVAPKYEVDYGKIQEQEKDIDFPVITKPTDGSGSTGFSVCYNAEELKRGYEIASKASFSGGVIVEKFVKNDGIVVFYTLSDGKLCYSGIEDKYPVKYEKQGSYVAGMFVFESKLSSEFREKYEEKLSQMFSSIGMKEGSVWIEVFYDNGKYYFNEVGYRYGGSISIYPVDYLHGINQVAADITYALTGKSKIHGYPSLVRDDVPERKYYGIYAIHVKPGVIRDICGIDEMMKFENIVTVPVNKSIGYKVEDSGTFAQVVALVHFVFDDKKECCDILNKIHDTIKIIDQDGNNMTVKKLDF